MQAAPFGWGEWKFSRSGNIKRKWKDVVWLKRPTWVSTEILITASQSCTENEKVLGNGTASFGWIGPTRRRGLPLEVDLFARQISMRTEAFHLLIERNFRRFWRNGKHLMLTKGALFSRVSWRNFTKCHPWKGLLGTVSSLSTDLRPVFYQFLTVEYKQSVVQSQMASYQATDRTGHPGHPTENKHSYQCIKTMVTWQSFSFRGLTTCMPGRTCVPPKMMKIHKNKDKIE